MKSGKSRHRLCEVCLSSHVIRQLAAWEGGFQHYPPFTDEETQPQRREAIGPMSAQLAGLSPKPMPSTISVFQFKLLC